MEVYSHGDVVGVSISSIWVMIFIVYLTLEILSTLFSRIPVLYKIFLYFRVRDEVKKVIPLWWEIKDISAITMAYRGGYIECYVAVHQQLDGHIWTNDHIKINWTGNIIKTELVDNINRLDGRVGIGDSVKKQYTRDKALSELGIK